jgi:hypothetical protein
MAVQFKKATRQAVKLKLAVSGPSGSGKTLGALALARALAPAGKVALIDTENGSASLYGDRFEFDALDLAPPFTSARYLEAMQAAVEAGYEVLVIDSLSHQWAGEGGILSRKEELDKRGGNSFTNWATFTKEHTAFVSQLLHMPVHVIATLRSKQDYVIEEGNGRKSTPKKVGLAPVQREGLEYEFSTVFDLQMDHKAAASKDRTGLFGEGLVDLTDKQVGKKLLAWLETGTPWLPTQAVATHPKLVPVATTEQIDRLRFLITDERLSEDVVAKVESALKRGLLEAKAALWIRQIEQQLAAHRTEAPRVVVTGSTADPALVEHFASQPDPYTGEAGELPLDDRKAPSRDALREG